MIVAVHFIKQSVKNLLDAAACNSHRVCVVSRGQLFGLHLS